MNTKTLLLVSFFLGLSCTIIGALQMILHNEGAYSLLIIGVICSLVFIVTALYEVFSSTHISRNEKILWAVGFIFISGIVGIVYLLVGRHRVVNPS